MNQKPLTLKAAAEAAENIIREVAEWPYDEWWVIAPNWVLNLWTDGEYGLEHFAELYPVDVVTGKIQTLEPYEMETNRD